MSSTSLLTSISETVSVLFATPLVPQPADAPKIVAIQLMEMPPSRTSSRSTDTMSIAPMVSIDASFGVVFVGAVISYALYGITCGQVVRYYAATESDDLLLRGMASIQKDLPRLTEIRVVATGSGGLGAGHAATVSPDGIQCGTATYRGAAATLREAESEIVSLQELLGTWLYAGTMRLTLPIAAKHRPQAIVIPGALSNFVVETCLIMRIRKSTGMKIGLVLDFSPTDRSGSSVSGHGNARTIFVVSECNLTIGRAFVSAGSIVFAAQSFVSPQLLVRRKLAKYSFIVAFASYVVTDTAIAAIICVYLSYHQTHAVRPLRSVVGLVINYAIASGLLPTVLVSLALISYLKLAVSANMAYAALYLTHAK
ncbi:hypothetical protein GLOTRDRAFT_139194, partial [Gloeophyllum trabeum ATCC 11539]